MYKITPTLEDSLVLMRWLAGVLIIFVLILTLVMVNKLTTLGKQNHTYLRTEACILSVPLNTRTPDYIQNCYLKAEQFTGTKVDHFGEQ